MIEPNSVQHRFSDAALKRLRCSYCGGSMRFDDGGATCTDCACRFSWRSSGALDLRLPHPRTYSFDVVIGAGPILDEVDFLPLKVVPRSKRLDSFASEAWHIDRALMGQMPEARTSDAMALDLGCGAGAHRDLCQRLGYDWVGLDYSADEAPLLGDAHALPFADETFDFVLSLAVLEHLQFPIVAMREVYRTMKPGGIFIGTVAFLEPFHGRSYYHHTHLGTLNTLQAAGFSVSHVSPTEKWTVLEAQADMAFFPRMPAVIRSILIAPLDATHRLWWYLGELAGRVEDPTLRLRQSSGSFAFIARKPLDSETQINKGNAVPLSKQSDH